MLLTRIVTTHEKPREDAPHNGAECTDDADHRVIPSIVGASAERNRKHKEERKAGELNDSRYRNNHRVVWELDIENEKQSIDSEESQKRNKSYFPFESVHTACAPG